MSFTFDIITPVDGSVYATRAYHTLSDARAAVERCRAAQRAWRRRPLRERAHALTGALNALARERTTLADELTYQIGRPISQSHQELTACEVQARRALLSALEAPSAPLHRPHGVTLHLTTCHAPLLTPLLHTLNALIEGDGVILKHSTQSALCGERIAETLAEADLPDGLVTPLHLERATTRALIAEGDIDLIRFTGSAEGGRALLRAASEPLTPVHLEVSGCDAAYVRADAPLIDAVRAVVEGTLLSAGQSAFATQRVYVHEALFDDFLEGAAALTGQRRLDDPRLTTTDLGPVLSLEAARRVRQLVEGARAAGAHLHIDPEHFYADTGRSPYLAPQLISGVSHEMPLMRERCSGPVICVMPVRDDEEATRLINDSRHARAAVLWTRDEEAAARLALELTVGEVCVNRRDPFTPCLTWRRGRSNP